jgi:DNA-binding Lrp family transcriptional regulator
LGFLLSTITADEYFDKIHQIVSLLDEENILILRTMKQHGPRNLLGIARKAKLPYTTVYNRVTKLENLGVLNTRINPNYSKIGLARAMVLATPFPGREVLTREALKIPGYWLRIARSIGDCNGYYSLHAIPLSNRRDFELYLDQLAARGFMKDHQIFWLSESYSPLPNFDYFSIKDRTWRFDWKAWSRLSEANVEVDHKRQAVTLAPKFDKKDLIILKELAKDARATLASLTKLLSMTLPAAKYRFDRLVANGFIEDYVMGMLPYAPDISELCEVRLDFFKENLLIRTERMFSRLPIVLTYSRIMGLNSLAARIYIPRRETINLLTFLSSLVKDGVLATYSYMQLEPLTIQAQTFAYKDYDDQSGWQYDNHRYLETLDNLTANWSKRETETLTPQAIASTYQ